MSAQETQQVSKLVTMDSHDMLYAPSDESSKIYTQGLCGCTAVASVAKFKNGDHLGYVQHYSPSRRHVGLVGLLGFHNEVARYPIVGTHTTVMTPGAGTEPLPEDQLLVELLLESTQNPTVAVTTQVKLYDRAVDFTAMPVGHLLGIQFVADDQPTVFSA